MHKLLAIRSEQCGHGEHTNDNDVRDDFVWLFFFFVLFTGWCKEREKNIQIDKLRMSSAKIEQIATDIAFWHTLANKRSTAKMWMWTMHCACALLVPEHATIRSSINSVWWFTFYIADQGAVVDAIDSYRISSIDFDFSGRWKCLPAPGQTVKRSLQSNVEAWTCIELGIISFNSSWAWYSTDIRYRSRKVKFAPNCHHATPFDHEFGIYLDMEVKTFEDIAIEYAPYHILCW